MTYSKSIGYVYWQGDFCFQNEVAIDVHTQSLYYGNGVFEGLRSYKTPEGTQIFQVDAHIDRFCEAAAHMSLSLEESPEEIKEICYELLEKNKLEQAYIRPILFSGQGMSLRQTEKAHLLVSCWQWGRYHESGPVSLMLSSQIRPSDSYFPVQYKVSGNYVTHTLATNEAKRMGYHDALMLDEFGFVAQCASANLFIEKDEVLYTPCGPAVMPGITRKVVLDLAQILGIEVREVYVKPEDLMQADSAFLCGTAIEITGVSQVEQHPFPIVWEESIGYAISCMYHHLVRQTASTPFTLI